jgi:hypothetical protein
MFSSKKFPPHRFSSTQGGRWGGGRVRGLNGGELGVSPPLGVSLQGQLFPLRINEI